jgi:hypothetical protein
VLINVADNILQEPRVGLPHRAVLAHTLQERSEPHSAITRRLSLCLARQQRSDIYIELLVAQHVPVAFISETPPKNSLLPENRSNLPYLITSGSTATTRLRIQVASIDHGIAGSSSRRQNNPLHVLPLGTQGPRALRTAPSRPSMGPPWWSITNTG